MGLLVSHGYRVDAPAADGATLRAPRPRARDEGARPRCKAASRTGRRARGKWDRDRKGSLYARASVGDYWIVNLVAGVLEVYRDPERVAATGWRYATLHVMKPRAVISPLGAPRGRIRVADLLI